MIWQGLSLQDKIRLVRILGAIIGLILIAMLL